MMYPAFVYKIYENFELMPIVLKIVCGAAFILGVLQFLAFIFPFLSPRIEGVTISTPILMIFMGGFHIIIGWGIYAKQKWSIPLIIVSPIFQYSILYLDKGFPTEGALKANLTIAAIWAAFFTAYFVLGRTRLYFRGDKNA